MPIRCWTAPTTTSIIRKDPVSKGEGFCRRNDLTITGEGEKHLYLNLKSSMGPLEGYLQNPTCSLTIVDKPRRSQDLAAVWVQAHCDAYMG
jgi:hypothetical protein